VTLDFGRINAPMQRGAVSRYEASNINFCGHLQAFMAEDARECLSLLSASEINDRLALDHGPRKPPIFYNANAHQE
jgi:hypothetical protein